MTTQTRLKWSKLTLGSEKFILKSNSGLVDELREPPAVKEKREKRKVIIVTAVRTIQYFRKSRATLDL